MARMSQPPGFDILIAALKIIGIFETPYLVPHPLALSLTFFRPAALLALAQPPVRHKIPPARDTLLFTKQFELIHKRSVTAKREGWD